MHYLRSLLLLTLPAGLFASDGPLTPTQSLKTFLIEEGARIELAASEPELRDPVAMCFDARGHMFVVESLPST